MHCRRQSREIKDRGQSVLEIGKQPSPPFEIVVAMKICNINKAVDALKAKAFLPGPFLCGGETPTSEPLLLNSKRPLCHQGPNCYFQTRDGQTHVPILLSCFLYLPSSWSLSPPQPFYVYCPPCTGSFLIINAPKQDPIISLVTSLWQVSVSIHDRTLRRCFRYWNLSGGCKERHNDR